MPGRVYQTAVAGAHVLRSVKAGDVGEDPEVVKKYLWWACRAGLDLPVIRGLAEKCGKVGIDSAAEWASPTWRTDTFAQIHGRANQNESERIDTEFCQLYSYLYPH